MFCTVPCSVHYNLVYVCNENSIYINLHVFLLLYSACFFWREKNRFEFRLPVCRQMFLAHLLARRRRRRRCRSNINRVAGTSNGSLSETELKVWLMLFGSPLLGPFIVSPSLSHTHNLSIFHSYHPTFRSLLLYSWFSAFTWTLAS